MIKKKVCNFDAHGIFINFARITKNVMYYQSNSYLFPNVYLRHNKSIRRSIIQPFKSSYDCHRIFITIRQNNGQKNQTRIKIIRINILFNNFAAAKEYLSQERAHATEMSIIHRRFHESGVFLKQQERKQCCSHTSRREEGPSLSCSSAQGGGSETRPESNGTWSHDPCDCARGACGWRRPS